MHTANWIIHIPNCIMVNTQSTPPQKKKDETHQLERYGSGEAIFFAETHQDVNNLHQHVRHVQPIVESRKGSEKNAYMSLGPRKIYIYKFIYACKKYTSIYIYVSTKLINIIKVCISVIYTRTKNHRTCMLLRPLKKFRFVLHSVRVQFSK